MKIWAQIHPNFYKFTIAAAEFLQSSVAVVDGAVVVDFAPSSA